MELARITSFFLRIALALALICQLKACTLELMGLAAEKTDRGMISYSKYSRLLTAPSTK